MATWIGALLLAVTLWESQRLVGHVRRAARSPLARWSLWFSVVAILVALAGAWMIDQANAGIHPGRRTLAQLLVANGLLFGFVAFLATVLLSGEGPPAEESSPNG